MKVKIERTKKDIAAQQLSDSRFHQRVVPTKKGYNRKAEKRVEY